MTDGGDGIASAADFAKPEKAAGRVELTRMQRTGYLDKDSATRRILDLEDENERYRKALERIGAMDRLSYNPGEDPRGVAREALAERGGAR